MSAPVQDFTEVVVRNSLHYLRSVLYVAIASDRYVISSTWENRGIQ